MIEYVGEHLWAGQLGHTLAIVSLVGAVLGTLGYLLGTLNKADEWIRLGRIGFRLHSVAVVGIVVTLFTMLFNHWFEYDYVWKHSNLAMPMKYIFDSICGWLRIGRVVLAIGRFLGRRGRVGILRFKRKFQRPHQGKFLGALPEGFFPISTLARVLVCKRGRVIGEACSLRSRFFGRVHVFVTVPKPLMGPLSQRGSQSD